MAKYKVNQEGVDSLHNLETAIRNAMERAYAVTSQMKSAVTSNPEGAGPHYNEIEDTVNDVENVIREMEEPVEQVLEKILELADTYEEIISMNFMR